MAIAHARTWCLQSLSGLKQFWMDANYLADKAASDAESTDMTLAPAFMDERDFGRVLDALDIEASLCACCSPILCRYTLSKSSPHTSIDGATMKSIKPSVLECSV